MSSPELHGHGSFGSERNSERVDQPFTSQTLESSRFGSTVFESAGCEKSMIGSSIIEAPIFETPLFEAAGWSQLDGHAWEVGSAEHQVEVSYINAGTCPDCGNGMIRLGLCMTCPCCGYGSCGE